jgi:hypothetical protein
MIHCPLYIAAHMAVGLGCDDGRLGEGFCAIGRGLDYAREKSRIEAKFPRVVAELAFAESAAESREQVKRNMRINRIN